MREIFGERVKAARKIKRLTAAELAEIMAVGQNTVSRWETGTRAPDFETVRKLSRELDTSVAYLLGETDDPTPLTKWRGELPKNIDTQEIVPNAHPISPEHILLVPMVSPEITASAGIGNNYGVDAPPLETVGTYPVYDAALSAYYSSSDLSSMRVDGDSMEPHIHHGDIVVFNHSSTWVSGNIMVVCLDGRLLVKGLIYNGQNKPPLLRSTNPDYSDITLNEDSFFIIYGRVLKIITERPPKQIL